jgi:hypothetical protein
LDALPAKVDALKRVQAETAAECALERGQSLTEMRAAYYYRFQLHQLRPIARRNVGTIVHQRPARPVARTLSEFATCPII